MQERTPQSGQLVNFLRQRDYKLIRVLGEGACGQTVLLHDELIDHLYVCKKYSPFSEAHREELFENFVREIKLLHLLNHRNVVRVFNHYLYPTQFAGYILLEYVDGLTVDKYISAFPERISEVFLQTIAGFSHLEEAGVLHRDIRPANLMVCKDECVVKIIDLGFGKRVVAPTDFAKSISLNWAYDPPLEFEDRRYDFQTEVYFVGKLFEGLIRDAEITEFKFRVALSKMCEPDPRSRSSSFREVSQQIGTDQFAELKFTEWEIGAYRAFAEAVAFHITKIEKGAQYVDDANRISTQLDDLYRTFMLESTVPNCAPILRALINGQYYYKRSGMVVACVRDFARLIKGCDHEKRRIVLANLHTRLDAVPRYAEAPFRDEDVPF